MKEFKEKCILRYETEHPHVITNADIKTFKELNWSEELKGCLETYSYDNKSSMVGYYDKYFIKFNKSIDFNEDSLKSLQIKNVPLLFINNINTLRFMNPLLNVEGKIELLVGFFYKNCNVLEQLYKYGITDHDIMFLFSINYSGEYLTNNFNKFYSQAIMLTQKEYMKAYKPYLIFKYKMWIIDKERTNDEPMNIIRNILIQAKNRHILNYIFEFIFATVKGFNKTHRNEFLIMNESEKIKYIKSLLVKHKPALSLESIYYVVRDTIVTRYMCKNFKKDRNRETKGISIEFIKDYLLKYDITLTSNKYIKAVSDINNLIERGLYLKGKQEEIASYLGITIPTMIKIIKENNLPKPYQKLSKSEDYTTYFLKMYGTQSIKQYTKKTPEKAVITNIVETPEDLLEDCDFQDWKRKKAVKNKFIELKKIPYSKRNKNIEFN